MDNIYTRAHMKLEEKFIFVKILNKTQEELKTVSKETINRK